MEVHIIWQRRRRWKAAEGGTDTDGLEFIWIMEKVFVESNENVVADEGPDWVRDLPGKEELSQVLDEVSSIDRGVGGEGVLAEIVEEIGGVAEGARGFATGGGAHGESDEVKLKGGDSGREGRVRRTGRIQRVRVHFPQDGEVMWGQESLRSRVKAFECRTEVAMVESIGN